MWMDHRAAEQAETINSTRHPVLKYCGGKISLEMQTPKLLWLKQVHVLKSLCHRFKSHRFSSTTTWLAYYFVNADYEQR
jgi:ribulose kinase